MNPAMIPAYLEARMKELGHCNGYVIRIKHFVLDANQTLKISAFGELYILLEHAADIKIESETGVFNTTTNATQQQHEHSGQMTLTNLSGDGECHVQFVQAIPLDPAPETCKTC